MLLGTKCGNLTALISAHQSIGVPQPLLLFGTEEQKAKYLPRFARGEISAFALTEAGVGSDPSKMTTRAEPTEDGKHFIINGEKLWCTNGTKAGVIIVMAATPPKLVNGKERKQVTAFIVDTNEPGLEVKQRCHFMGLKALYNGVMTFKNVKVPRENIVLGEGKGLKVALSTLNTGRLTLPAACTGMTRECIRINKKWSNERRQWGNNIGKHAAIAEKISKMTAQLFAMESMVLLTSALVDRKEGDIRLEAAMCKMWGTEKAWHAVDETMQIRGGRGYETAASQKARGEEPVPVERFMRDCRINTIFEGSSEIMRLFLAREALDPHLSVAGEALNTRLPISKRLQSAIKAGMFYSLWYPKMWFPSTDSIPDVHPRLKTHLRYVAKTSRKLARALFHAMALYGPKLEKQQPLLARYVEIGTELFVITASVLRADSMMKKDRQNENEKDLLKLVHYITKESKLEIKNRFRSLHQNNDRDSYSIAQSVLDGKYDELLKRV
jgi:alkylation response protein AidB-like acyl-CoA dehydrogenase